MFANCQDGVYIGKNNFIKIIHCRSSLLQQGQFVVPQNSTILILNTIFSDYSCYATIAENPLFPKCLESCMILEKCDIKIFHCQFHNCNYSLPKIGYNLLVLILNTLFSKSKCPIHIRRNCDTKIINYKYHFLKQK
jgi:hypothetical protein